MSESPEIRFLQTVRREEIRSVLPWFPAPEVNGQPSRVLDLGAGTGDQAQYLASLGYQVTALEVSSSAYRAERVYPIVEYDGFALPIADCCVDIVFSSNVLEHVAHVDEMLEELARVHAPGARSVHILPTSAWRFWTAVSHYGWLAKRIVAPVTTSAARLADASSPRPHERLARSAVDMVPRRHGERGSTLTELIYFSKHWWEKRFQAHGYRLVESFPVGIFYTGATLLGTRVSLASRRRMAKWLGSACRAYVLERPGEEP